MRQPEDVPGAMFSRIVPSRKRILQTGRQQKIR